MKNYNLNLAAYSYRRAAYHAANGDAARAAKCLETARAYDGFAIEEAKT